jgi:serine/threonine-protein kinase
MASEPTERQRTIGDYVLGPRIAVGGMAEVFEARRADGIGPPLVIKVLLPQYSGDSEIVEALRHEAEISRTLAHDSIVRVIDFGTHEGETWLAMERVDGGSLAELVADARGRGGGLSLAAALHVGRELLEALSHVHEAKTEAGAPLGIVHRDVTPENLLVSRSGDVRLADFGIARSAKRGGRTRTGVIKGKLAYLSPEQATGSALDARTDLYSAGVVLWELVTGRRWLEAETEIDLLRAAEKPEFRVPSEIVGTPVALDAVLERALRRFPEERFASARAMRDALAAVERSVAGDGRAELAALAVEAFDATPFQPESRAAPAGGSLPTTRFVSYAVAGAAAVVLVGGALLTRFGEEASTPAERSPLPLVMEDGGSAPGRDAGGFTLDAASVVDIVDAARTDTSITDLRRSPRRLDASRRAVRDAGRTVEDERAASLRARRSSVEASLSGRGIRRADLPAAVRDQLGQLDRAFEDGRWDDAAYLLDLVEPAVAEVRVDASFVRRRLDRVGARIAAARRRGANTRQLEDLAADALQLFLDGRLDQTNRRLDEIEARISTSP